MSDLFAHYNYWVVIFLMMTGFYIVVARGNLVKKIVGLNLFQASVFILYISLGKVVDGNAPIFTEGVTVRFGLLTRRPSTITRPDRTISRTRCW